MQAQGNLRAPPLIRISLAAGTVHYVAPYGAGKQAKPNHHLDDVSHDLPTLTPFLRRGLVSELELKPNSRCPWGKHVARSLEGRRRV